MLQPMTLLSLFDQITFLIVAQQLDLSRVQDPYGGMGFAWRAFFCTLAQRAFISFLFLMGDFGIAFVHFRAVCRSAKVASACVWRDCVCWHAQSRVRRLGFERPFDLPTKLARPPFPP